MPIHAFNQLNGADRREGQVVHCPWRTGEGWKRRFHYFHLRFRRLQGTPRRAAGGTAIGVFIGMTPTVPLQTILAVSLAIIFRQSKLAAAIGTQIANPLFLPFIYFLNYQVGRWFMGIPPLAFVPESFSLVHLVELGWRIAYPTLMGGVITGLVLSIPAYFIIAHSIALYRKKGRKR